MISPDAGGGAIALSGFELLDELHASRRSVVYRARRLSDDRRVILKANGPDLTPEQALARHEHERAVLALVDSELIVKAYDVVRGGALAALVLEDFPGEALAHCLDWRTFGLAEALEVAVGICRALRDVHQAGVFHRDVNPHNVLYDQRSRSIKLIDFDIATGPRGVRAASGPDGTLVGALAGTLAYLAPEQTGRMNRVADQRADLYSLGMTLYQLLTGRLPHDLKDSVSLVHFHLAVTPAPPHELVPDLPPVLSDLVMKLLAKAPEDRYQTAAGAHEDLAAILRQQRAGRAIEPFPLARQDHSDRFEVSGRLVGRQAERRVLRESFDRCAQGGVQTVLLSGASGVGKSSLVRELPAFLGERPGHLATGKFDQLRRDVPCSALVAALEDLTLQLLARSDGGERGPWRQAILAAAGPNAGVLVEAVPMLEQLLGPQPPLPALDAAGVQKRFHLTVQKFIQAASRHARPLVLFLDDVQWADDQSLRLLKAVVDSSDTEALLLIMAFRDGEWSQLALFSPKEGKAPADRQVRVELLPLSAAQVTELLAETLHRERESVARLAGVVWRKTKGNPFFLRQLLQALHEQGRIFFDAERRYFDFDLAAIEKTPLTDNVADLLAASLRRLPAETQQLLTLAAAVGGRFELATLATVAGRPLTAVRQALEAAVIEELITPIATLAYDGAGKLSSTANGGFSHFAFHHDRIQQAAYAAVPDEDKPSLHLTIGRALLAGGQGGDLDDRLFDVVSHLNRGNALIGAPEERTQLAALNLRAGSKARRSGAHALAAANFRAAAALCSWSEDHGTCYAAHLQLVESLHLSGDFAGALAAADATLQHAGSSRERAELDAARAAIYLNMGDLRQCLACCRRAAGLMGLELPEDPAEVQSHLAEALGTILERLTPGPGGQGIEDLLDLPRLQDPDKLLVVRLLLRTMPAAYMSDPALFALFCARMVLLSLTHGNCAASAGAYAGLSVVLHTIGREDDGYRLGKLAVALVERLEDVTLSPLTLIQFAIFSLPWGEPLGESMAHLRRAQQLALQAGDYASVGYCAGFCAIHGLLLGLRLPELLEETERNRKLTSELGEVITSRMIAWLCQAIRAYRGELADPNSLDGAGFTEEALLRAAVESGNPTDQFWLHLQRAEHRYAAGQYEAARQFAEAAEALLATTPASVGGPQQRFYHSLALTACWERADEGQRAQWADKLAANQRQLQRWSGLGPQNFLSLYLLVEAERARVGVLAADALELYDQAIACAARQGFVKIEALANELAGQFWLGRNKRHLALVYLRRARDLYLYWGARRKVELLEGRFAELAVSHDLRGQQTTSSTTSLSASESLDLASVLRASQAISGELVLERLLRVMMEIILKNAGAQKGALVLEQEGGLFVEAWTGEQSPASAPSRSIPLREVDWLPVTIIERASSTGESLVLDDACHHELFSTDAYVRLRRPASILCMPIVHQATRRGVLYLENNLVRGAFTRARLEALEILVSQLTVSLDNATLFARQREQGEALVRMNEGLRLEIAERQRAEGELAGYRDRLEELVVARTRELEESREQYRRIVESTKAVPFTYSPAEGRFTYVGPQAEKLFGYPAERWREPALLEQLLPLEQRERRRGQLAGAAVGDELEFEGPAFTAEGKTLQLRWVVSCGEVGGERSLRGLILDVSERWRLESELAQAQKLESVGRLAAGVAHEINTPIQFVSDSVTFVRGAMKDLFGVLQAYQELPPLLDDRAALGQAAQRALQAEEDNDLAYVVEHAPGALERAAEGLERVADIVRAMKQFAHPDRQEKNPVDLNAALQSTLTIARNEYKYVADLETDFGELPRVLCHAGEINQAVLNIVVNAAHAIADAVAGTSEKGKITVRTRAAGGQVEIAIGDTGRGIPEAIRQRIFDPFFTTKEVGRGTGQGLAIARNVIAEKHGGSLTFHSEVGRGTTFYIRLPVEEGETARGEASASPAPPAERPLRVPQFTE